MSRYTEVLEKILGGEKKFSPEEDAIVFQRVVEILSKMKKEPEKAQDGE